MAARRGLRMLAESQVEPISKTSSWAAGLAFGKRLEAAGLADLSFFEQIQDLFAPHAAARTRFSLWHAAVLEDGKPALFKAYVNPCLLGSGSAPYGRRASAAPAWFADAWCFLAQRLAENPGAEIRYFSVDLEAADSARVKVYLGSSQSADAVDRLISGGRNSQPNDAQHWLHTLTASQGPFDARPILSCFSFRAGSVSPDVTVHVPITLLRQARRRGAGSCFQLDVHDRRRAPVARARRRFGATSECGAAAC